MFNYNICLVFGFFCLTEIFCIYLVPYNNTLHCYSIYNSHGTVQTLSNLFYLSPAIHILKWQITWKLGSSGPSFPHALPLALRDLCLPQSHTNLVLPFFFQTENWEHAQIFLFFHHYPAVLQALQHPFSSVSISDVSWNPDLSSSTASSYCTLVLIGLTWISLCINSKLWINAKTCTMFLLVQHCLQDRGRMARHLGSFCLDEGSLP